MTDTIKLQVQKRTEKGRKMRENKKSQVPAIIYGKNQKNAQMIWVDAVELVRVFEKAGTNTVIEIVMDNQKKSTSGLIYDFQTDPITNQFTHVDFYLVDMKEEVETEIPLEFIGVSAAVKEHNGTLIKNHDELTVKALPAHLPQVITIDLTQLATFDDNIMVKDIVVNKDYHIIAEQDTIIASVVEPRSEEELASLDDAVDADVSKVQDVEEKENKEEKTE